MGIEKIEMMWDDVAEAEDRGRKDDFHCVCSVDMKCTVRYRLRGSAQHMRNVGTGWAHHSTMRAVKSYPGWSFMMEGRVSFRCVGTVRLDPGKR